LKSSVTALPDGTVVGFESLVDDPALWPLFLPVPEEVGAHVVVLDACGADVQARTGHASAVRVPWAARGRS
jgi:hypothetical protein